MSRGASQFRGEGSRSWVVGSRTGFFQEVDEGQRDHIAADGDSVAELRGHRCRQAFTHLIRHRRWRPRRKAALIDCTFTNIYCTWNITCFGKAANGAANQTRPRRPISFKRL